MRQQNRKTPLVFRIGVGCLILTFLSTSMMTGYYAKYNTGVFGFSIAQVAKISYSITEGKSSSHGLDVNDFDDPGEVVAIEETFVLENDGDVSFEFVINDLYFKAGAPDGYQFASITDEIYLLSSDGATQKNASLKSYTGINAGAKLYYSLQYKNASKQWYALNGNEKITGTLPYGEKVTITFLYFVDFRESSNKNIVFDQPNMITCSITCSQID